MTWTTNADWKQPAGQTAQQGEDMGKDIGFDDVITKDPTEYILLDPGTYEFEVEKYERGRFKGSAKMSACNMVTLTLRVKTEKADCGYITVQHRLFLNTKVEGRISEFFTSIGLKKKGEPLRMNWNLVPGAKGYCQVDTNEYNGNKYNQVKKFYVPAASDLSDDGMPF